MQVFAMIGIGFNFATKSCLVKCCRHPLSCVSFLNVSSAVVPMIYGLFGRTSVYGSTELTLPAVRSVTLNLANKFSQCTFSVTEHYDLFSGLIILRQA